ncbi:MAG: MoaD/ThiS family protein [Rhizobiales bacterium]|nr:MoaD/ThiS family protein [Hyphomicrobiales bacterium]
MQITIQTFGAFRRFGRKIEILLAEQAAVTDIRKPLYLAVAKQSAEFDIEALIDSSRFATEERILAEDEMLLDGQLITILPPVSGG